MMTEPDETEATIPEADPFRQAAWPFISLVLESTKEGSLRRAEAMRQVLTAVERVRQILTRAVLN